MSTLHITRREISFGFPMFETRLVAVPPSAPADRQYWVFDPSPMVRMRPLSHVAATLRRLPKGSHANTAHVSGRVRALDITTPEAPLFDETPVFVPVHTRLRRATSVNAMMARLVHAAGSVC
jgi:hypothetical protein